MEPSTTDWIMVVITGIYVIATVFIFIANNKSANVTRAQLAESKQQYSETKRLASMPCFYIHAEDRNTGFFESVEITDKITGNVISMGYKFATENIGNGIAKDVHFYISTEFVGKKEIAKFPLVPVFKSPHDQRLIFPLFFADKGGFKNKKLTATLLIEFSDLFSNQYAQPIKLVFSEEQASIELEITEIQAPVQLIAR